MMINLIQIHVARFTFYEMPTMIARKRIPPHEILQVTRDLPKKAGCKMKPKWLTGCLDCALVQQYALQQLHDSNPHTQAELLFQIPIGDP